MDYSIGHWMSLETHRLTLVGYASVISASVLSAWGAAADAAPIAFRFDAQITHTLGARPFNLPFNYQVGDVISGSFTFDPNIGVPFGDNALDSKQEYPVNFQIDETMFGTSRYGIRVVNHDPPPGSPTPFEVFDGITLACSPTSLQRCMPEVLSYSGFDAFSITARLQLGGEGLILSAPVLPPDLATWNAFVVERRLSVTFDSENGGSMLLLADVGQFSLIPEPTNVSGTIWIFAVLMIGVRLRKKSLSAI